MTQNKQTCLIWPDCECGPDVDCRALGNNESAEPARIIHAPFDGENKIRTDNPPGTPLAGKILLGSIALTLALTVSSMIIRHLNHAEAAWQMASRV